MTDESKVKTVTVCDGKYTVVLQRDGGRATALRYGDFWQDLTGNNLVCSLAEELHDAREALRRWQRYGCPDCGGDCASANPPVACCIMQETRAALAAKS